MASASQCFPDRRRPASRKARFTLRCCLTSSTSCAGACRRVGHERGTLAANRGSKGKFMSNNLKTANVRLAGVLATLLVIAISEVGVTRLHAQGASATLLGTVTDATGAAVPGASVQAKN